jgi:hypothetical protein
MTAEPQNTATDDMIAEVASLLTELEDADPQAYRDIVERMPFMTGEVFAGRWKADEQILIDLRDVIRKEIDHAVNGGEDTESV